MTTYLFNDLLPLPAVKLGRLVLNTEHPTYEFLDPLENRPSVTDFNRNSQVGFTEMLKSSESPNLRLYLRKKNFIEYQESSSSTFTGSAPLVIKYDLLDSEAWFLESCTELTVQSFLERAIGDGHDVYLIVGLCTVKDSRLDKGKMPVQASTTPSAVVGSGLLALGNKDIGNDQKITFNALGEQVFAIRYRKVSQTAFQLFALWMPHFDWRGMRSCGGGGGFMDAALVDDIDMRISNNEYSNDGNAEPPRIPASRKEDLEIVSLVQEDNAQVAKTPDYTELVDPMSTASSSRLISLVPKEIKESGNLQDLTAIINLGLEIYKNRDKQAERWWLDIQTFATEGYQPVLYHLEILMDIAERVESYRYIGQWKEAEELGIEVIIARKAFLGLDHLNTLESMATLATVYKSQKRWNEAEEIWQDVVRRSERLLGVDHPFTLKALGDLEMLYDEDEFYEEIEGWQKEKRRMSEWASECVKVGLREEREFWGWEEKVLMWEREMEREREREREREMGWEWGLERERERERVKEREKGRDMEWGKKWKREWEEERERMRVREMEVANLSERKEKKEKEEQDGEYSDTLAEIDRNIISLEATKLAMSSDADTDIWPVIFSNGKAEISFESGNPWSSSNEAKILIERVFNAPINWWPMTPRRSYSPREYTRVNWKCCCGKRLSSIVPRECMEQYYWWRCATNTPSPLTPLAISTAIHNSQGSSSTGVSHPAAVGNNLTIHRPNHSGAPLVAAQVTAVVGSTRDKLLMWCVNSGPTIVTDVSILPVYNDTVVFKLLRAEYRRIRGWRRWLSLYTLSEVRFVKFRRFMYLWERVNCYNNQQLPDHTDPEYEYAPSPAFTVPPIPSEELMHYLESPSCPTSSRVIQMFPKKITGPMTDEIGWGLHAYECLSFLRIFIISFLLLIIPILFVPYWLRKHPGDLANALSPILVFLAAIAILIILPSLRGAKM